jgi:hypothetical protein
MKRYALFFYTIIALGCAPSVTQKISKESDNRNYEIVIKDGLKLKKSVLKAVDSLANVTISNILISNDDLKECHFVININELNWYCPEKSKIDAQSFAVGFAGGLIGSTIWGTTNFTTVYGISKLDITVNRGSNTLNIMCNDTVNFRESYLSFSSSGTKKKAMCNAFTKSVINLMEKINDKQVMTSGNWQ